MAELPVVGGSENIWGEQLINFLLVSHNTDGTIVRLYDTDGLHYLNVDLSGNYILSLTDNVALDQNLRKADSPTFADLTLTGWQSAYTIDKTLEAIVNPGVLESITVTNEGGIAISWTAGKIYDFNGNIITIEAQVTPVNLTDNLINYLVWDSGTTLTVQTSEPSSTQIHVAHISCQSGDILEIHSEYSLNRRGHDIHHALAEHFSVTVSRGLVVQEDTDVTNPLDVYVSEGEYYHDMQQEHEVSQINSRTTPLIRWFHSSGNWTSDTNAQVETTNYDNGTNLAALTTNKWTKSLFLVSQSAIHWIYPQAQYDTEAQAIAAPLPTIPPGLSLFPKCTALVIRQGHTDFSVATFIDVRPLASLFVSGTGSIVTDHGALAGLTDDDHPQYLLVDGARAMSGDLDMGGNDIQNAKIITPIFNIQAFGAVGDDSTECATAIQNAIDAAEAVNGTVYIPEGTYKFSTGLTIESGIKFIGSNKTGSILKKYGDIVGLNVDASFVKLEGFTLDGGTNTLNGITLTGFSKGTIDNLIVTNQGNHGIEFLSGNLATFQNLVCVANGADGFKVNGTHDSPDTNACIFNNLDCRSNGGVGFNIENGRSNLGLLITCQSNGTYGIRINDRSNIIYAYCESNSTQDYYLTNDANTQRNSLYLLNGGYEGNVTDDSTGDNIIFAEQCGNNQAGFEHILRANSLQIPNWNYIATLDLTHNDADREFAFVAGGTGASCSLFFKHSNPTYKLNVDVDGDVTGDNLNIDNWDDAYDHSQLTSGNPHSVTPAELGLVIGTNVQAWDAQLDDIAALAVTDGNIIVGNGTNWVAESGATARSSLGLGITDSPQFAGLLMQADGGSIILKNPTNENGQDQAETFIKFNDHTDATLYSIKGCHDGTGDDTYGRFVISGGTIYGSSSEAFSLNSANRCMMGRVYGYGATDANLCVVQAGASGYIFMETFSDQNGESPNIQLRKSHTDTVGSLVTTGIGEILGVIDFRGVNGNGAFDLGARITATQISNAGASTVPCIMDFQTQLATGSVDSRLLIDAEGNTNLYGTLFLTEKAAASADVAGRGQIWVKNDTPNTLWFTNDEGTDVQLGVGGVGGASSYADLSALDGNTDVTGAELEELTDGSETTLHSHSYVDFVDRGNLSADDYDLGDLTADGTWHNLDLSSIVPAGAKAVKLRVSVNCTNYTTNNYIKFRKNGNTDSAYNIQLWKAFVNNLVITTEVFVFCDASRIIEYAIINTLTQCDIIVCGWII